MIKKAKWEDLHEHMKVWQYNGDPLPLIIDYILEDHLRAYYEVDKTFGLMFKKKGFGKPFNELYVDDKQKYEQLRLFDL